MTDLDLGTDDVLGWGVAVVIALPLVVVGLGEIQERLRQRRSQWSSVVAVIRIWLVPLLVLLTLTREVLGLDSDHILPVLIGTAAAVAGAVAALQAVRILVAAVRDRPRIDGQRAIPQLLLALPRALVIGLSFWILVAGVWGVDLSGALTALGVSSLVVSFALQDTLSGLASGMLLLVDQPFQPGDWIQHGDLEGRVVDVNWRSTRITNRDGDLVVVPNATLASATVVNYDEPSRLHRIRFPVQVAFVNPPNRAKEMLLAAARATPGVLNDPAPDVAVTAVDDPLMTYEVRLWIDDYTRRPQVSSDFGGLVWYWSERMGVPLPSPAQDLFLHDGGASGASGPDRAVLRSRLASAPLLAGVDADELDRLATTARQARFAAGEVIAELSAPSTLDVLIEGAAQIVVDGADGRSMSVTDLRPGDVFGLGGTGDELGVDQRAVATVDCEVVSVDGEVAAGVASRDPRLSRAINQLGTVRRRRLERALRTVEPASDPDEATDADAPEGGDG